MSALNGWNGGVIVISHDERFITTVAQELWVCADGSFTKFKGDVQAYKVGEYMFLCLNIADDPFFPESHRQQCQGKALDYHIMPSSMSLSSSGTIIYILLVVLGKLYYLECRHTICSIMNVSALLRESESHDVGPWNVYLSKPITSRFYGPEYLCLEHLYRYKCEQLKPMCANEAAKI